jgi:hypothetical protein
MQCTQTECSLEWGQSSWIHMLVALVGVFRVMGSVHSSPSSDLPRWKELVSSEKNPPSKCHLAMSPGGKKAYFKSGQLCRLPLKGI